jgi:hypothetical protein
VICPSPPGYGFSGKPATTGWGVDKIAKIWNTSMTRLGYDSYFKYLKVIKCLKERIK